MISFFSSDNPIFFLWFFTFFNIDFDGYYIVRTEVDPNPNPLKERETYIEDLLKRLCLKSNYKYTFKIYLKSISE